MDNKNPSPDKMKPEEHQTHLEDLLSGVKDTLPSHVIDEIRSFVHLVCTYLYAEERFLLLVERHLTLRILKRLRRYSKKSSTISGALYRVFQELGTPQKVALRYTEIVRSPSYGVGLIWLQFLAGILTGSLKEMLKSWQILSILGGVFILLIVAFLLQRIVSVRLKIEVIADGLILRQGGTQKFINWVDIKKAELKRGFLGTRLVFQLEGGQRVRITSGVRGFIYVVSCLIAHTDNSRLERRLIRFYNSIIEHALR